MFKNHKNKFKFKKAFYCISVFFTFAFSSTVFAQSIRVTGNISDKYEVIPGVNITIKGTTNGVISDLNGNYSIDVPNSQAVLEYSFIGYASQEVIVGNQRVINITLEEDVQLMDEVVVVGFSTQKKASVTGAITTINAKELRTTATSLSSTFAGKLSGVIAVQRTGEPGADGSNFWIRGISTFSGITSPLIFIDGVEMNTTDMNALAPEVIENFSVLKDATATALYGARGANGVILINTRQGRKNEKARINVRIEGQMDQPTQLLKTLDGVTYMEKFNEAQVGRGYSPQFEQSKIDGTRRGDNPYVYPNVNWQDMLFNKWSYSQTANINVAGGGDRVTYFMSALFNNDNGMLKSDPQNKYNNNISQQRYSMQGNIGVDLSATTKAFIRLNSQIVNYNGSHMTSTDIYSRMNQSPTILFPPYFPQREGTDHTMFGNMANGPHPQWGANLYYNVYSDMVRGYLVRNDNTSTVSFEMEQDLKFITPGFKAKGLVTFKNFSRTRITRTFTPYFYEVDRVNPDGSYIISDPLLKGTDALDFNSSVSGDRNMALQFTLEYLRNFADKHDVNGLLVFLQRDENQNNPGNYFASLPIRHQDLAGRATYGYDQRYLIEFNFGYSGSENFAKGHRFGFFPSFALGYNISNESFWDPVKPVVSNLKLRGSYGLIGNSMIGTSADQRFPYLTYVNLTGAGYAFGDTWQTVKNGAVVTRYGAEGAAWEKSKKLNVGIDLSLLNAWDVTFDVWKENRSGIFMRYRTIPVESGLSRDLAPWANLGKVEANGFDASLNYNKAFLNNDLIINLRGTFTFAKNTLIDRDEPENTPAYRSELGKSLNCVMALTAIGFFKDQADIDNSPTQNYQRYGVGDIKYKDMNGDGQIDDNDKSIQGYPYDPQITWGGGISAAYRKLDFSLFFQGVAQTTIWLNGISPFNSSYSQALSFIFDDYWTPENPNADAKYPRLAALDVGGPNNHEISSFWMRDGSFFRLKNAEFGYTYKFARIYLSGRNLLTFSGFKHWDPEIGGYSSNRRGNGTYYPPTRTFSIGAQFTF